MKIAQYSDSKHKDLDNKSFQVELWDKIWSKNSHQKLKEQLLVNPQYWRLRKIIEKSDKILEAGCGFGQWVSLLTDEGYNITGVDNAESTVKKLKKEYSGLKIDLGDVEKLSYKSNSFDVYLSFGVIEHFLNGPGKVLTEAHRVLKKNGLLFLTVPYLNLPRFLRFGLSKNINNNFYQYLYSRNEIVGKIEKAGFRVTSIKHYDFLSALKKDFPFFYNFSIKLIDSYFKKRISPKLNSGAKARKAVEPSFTIAKILYKLDSYVLLIEARK